MDTLAPAGIFSGGGEARSTKGRLVRGVTAWGVPGAEPPPRTPEKFSKNLLKNQ